jgi:hypothetical protein
MRFNHEKQYHTLDENNRLLSPAFPKMLVATLQVVAVSTPTISLNTNGAGQYAHYRNPF